MIKNLFILLLYIFAGAISLIGAAVFVHKIIIIMGR